MSNSCLERYETWQLEDVLSRYDGLRIVPSGDDRLCLAGNLRFRVLGPGNDLVDDTYRVEIVVPAGFPDDFPDVRETGERVPKDFHKLREGYLCVGAPTEIRLELRRSPSLLHFIERFVIPYLYGWSYFERHGKMPFGELAHGADGLRQHLAVMFGARDANRPEEFLRLASMKKRSANKMPCPCGSGRRLGRCHNRNVNQRRKEIGRAWFLCEYQRMLRLMRLYHEPDEVAVPTVGQKRLVL